MSPDYTLKLMKRLLLDAREINDETWLKFDLVMFDEDDKEDTSCTIRGWIQIADYWMFLYGDDSISLDYQPHDGISESDIDFDRIESFSMPPKPKKTWEEQP